MRYATAWGCRSRSAKPHAASPGRSFPFASPTTTDLPIGSTISADRMTINRKGRGGTGTSAAGFSPFATFTLKPLPHTNTLYEFFLRDIRISYSFAMIRDTKRLGIYTISRAFSRRGAIDFRKWSNNRSSGGRKRAADIFFFFHFRLHASTYYVHCIFFCVTSLFVRVYTVSPNDCTSVIARRV